MTPKEQALILIERFIHESYSQIDYELAAKLATITAETVSDSHKGLNGQWLYWVNVKNELKEL